MVIEDLIRLMAYILLLISVGFFVFSFGTYLKKYKIIQSYLAKSRNQIQEYNRIKREQIYLKTESMLNEHDTVTFSFMEKIYLSINQLGILEKLPGFHEVHILIGYGGILLAIGVLVALDSGMFSGVIITIALLIATFIMCKFIIQEKKDRLEEQLTSFLNACEGAATLHADIIDIFGDIYDRMKHPLQNILEECYVEAKVTNNKKLALDHLKNKISSTQFRSVINNLYTCSEITGDYRRTINDMRGPIRIYQACKRKKRGIVRNARVNVLIMTVLGVIILVISDGFFGGLKETLLETPIGLLLSTATSIVLLCGLTMRAKD